MSSYIVCHRKRNNPRVDVRICEKKCPSSGDCTEYLAYHKIMPQDKPVNRAAEPRIDLRAA